MHATRTVRIKNRNGLHARPAAKFVKLASAYRADIRVEKEDLEVNGKSIMGVLMLAAEPGATITIRGAGDDAEAAVRALVEYVEGDAGDDLLEQESGEGRAK